MALPAFVDPVSKLTMMKKFKIAQQSDDPKWRDESGPYTDFIGKSRALAAGLKRMPNPFNPVPSVILGAGGPKVKKVKARLRKKGKAAIKRMLAEAKRRPDITVGTRLKVAPERSV